MAKQRRAVVLLSGGLDSAVTLAAATRDGFEAYALTFLYGQRHDAAHARLAAREHVLPDDLPALTGQVARDVARRGRGARAALGVQRLGQHLGSQQAYRGRRRVEHPLPQQALHQPVTGGRRRGVAGLLASARNALHLLREVL